MPICKRCGKFFNLRIGMVFSPKTPICPKCDDSHTLHELYEMCATHECKCGKHLTENTMKSYTHDDGYKVKGFKTPQWVYLECPKCGYQNALWKLNCEIGNLGLIGDPVGGTWDIPN